MRIALLTVMDNAGSGQRYAEALRKHGHEALHITLHRHPYGYVPDLRPQTGDEVARAQRFIDQADVLHFKGDELPSDWQANAQGFLRLPDDKPVVITASGSGFRRRPKLSAPAPWQKEWYPLDFYRQQCHVLTAITPDLCVEPDIEWLPHAIDVMDLGVPRPGWCGPLDRGFFVGHAPSKRAVKGTDTVILPAVKRAQEAGIPVRLVLLEGRSNANVLRELRQCQCFIDQMNIPAYGMAAVEALALSIPVLTYLPRGSEPKQWPFPVILSSDPAQAVEELAYALSDVYISNRFYFHNAHRYVVATHGHEAIVMRLMAIYGKAQERHRSRKATFVA